MISCALVCLDLEENGCDGIIYADKSCKVGRIQESEESGETAPNNIKVWRKRGMDSTYSTVQSLVLNVFRIETLLIQIEHF